MPLRSPPANDESSSEALGSAGAGVARPEGALRPEGGALAVVRDLVEPLCRAHGVDLVDIRWVTEHAGRTLRITIERRAEGEQSTSADPMRGWGVTLSDCAELSRDVSQALDHAGDLIPGSYHLEVSSPGLERDLYGVGDFVRFRGALARVKLRVPAPDGQRLLRGTIEDVAGEPGSEVLTMLVDKKRIAVACADVAAANLVFEMSSPAEKSRPPKKTAKSGAGARAASSSKRSQSKGSGS
jgi:ribosome maturation factor RimP